MELCLSLGQQHPLLRHGRELRKGLPFSELTQRANPNAKIPQVEVVDFKDLWAVKRRVILRHLFWKKSGNVWHVRNKSY